MVKQIYQNFIGSEMGFGIIDFKHDHFTKVWNAPNLNHFKVDKINLLIKPKPDITQ